MHCIKFCNPQWLAIMTKKSSGAFHVSCRTWCGTRCHRQTWYKNYKTHTLKCNKNRWWQGDSFTRYNPPDPMTQISKTQCFLTLTRYNPVVSIGTNPTFKVKLVPMEYILTMSKRLHFFGSRFHLFNYTSSIFVLYFLRKKRVHSKIMVHSSL